MTSLSVGSRPKETAGSSISPKNRYLVLLAAVLGAWAASWGCRGASIDSSTHAMFRLDPGETAEDFFALPWPNDLRKDPDGSLSFAGYKAKTAFIRNYIDLFEEQLFCYGTQSGVYFRFTGPIQARSLPQTPGQAAAEGASVFIVDIDEASPEYGRRFPLLISYLDERPSVGTNALALLPYPGFALRPSTTYAAVVTRSVKGGDGRHVAPEPDFVEMLGEAVPSESRLHSMWGIYVPLRAYLAKTTISPSSIAVATIFTTCDPVSMMNELRQAVYREMPQVPSAMAFKHVKEYDAFDLFEGSYEGPNFQLGDPPYSKEGGGLLLDEDGKPMVVRVEQLRFALSVPKGVMPPEGWPVVLYSHGTGGSYKSFVSGGVAANLARIQDGLSVVGSMAVIGIDQVLHGPRCGADRCNPELNFFNFMNPLAGRDNVRQAAADNFQLVRLVLGMEISSAPRTGRPVRFDPARVYFMGHSQGGLTGPPFLAYEPWIRACVLSGAGGNMIFSLLLKTEPVDIPGMVAVILNEEIDEFHPLLGLIQTFIDPADPVNYGRLITWEPPWPNETKSVFQSQGIVDHYTPPDLIEALGVAMGITWVEPFEKTLDGFALHGQKEPLRRPLSGNLALGAATGAFVQYPAAEGEDGHFVVFDIEQAKKDYAIFLATSVPGGPPVIP